MPWMSSCTFSVSDPLPARNPAVSLSIAESTVTSTVSLAFSASLSRWSSCNRAPCAEAARGTSNADRTRQQLIAVRGFISCNLLNLGLCRRDGFARDLKRQHDLARRLLRVRVGFARIPLLLLLLDVVRRTEGQHQ